MLTQRQIRLLMLLESADGWVTSEALAARLSVSTRLVKQEVAALRKQLGPQAVESSPRCGYRIDRLDDEVRQRLAQDFHVHAGHHSIRRRYAQVFLMLVFAQKPLSYDAMAQRLFVSRATIADQIEVVRYRITRLAILELRVTSAGVCVQAREEERRYEASKWVERDRLDALFADGAEAEAFWDVRTRALAVAERELDPLVSTGRLSGDDLKRVASWCALSAWRSGAGQRIVWNGALRDYRPLEDAHAHAKSLVEVMAQQGVCNLDDAEGAALAWLLSDFIVPLEPSPRAHAYATQLLGELSLAMGEDPVFREPRTRRVIATRIDGIIRRTGAGHGVLNYHASETVARYPLGSYLAVSFLNRMMPGHVPKAEATLLALALASVVARAQPTERAVLYTDENTAVIGCIRSLVSRRWHGRFHIDEIRPAGWGEPSIDATVELATDPTAVVRHPDAFAIPALPSEDDLAQLERALDRRRAARRAELRQELVSVDAAAEAFVRRACAGTCAQATTLTVYRTVCAVERAGSGGSFIRACEVAEPIAYRGKRYRRAVHVRWAQEGASARDLFETLSDVLLEQLKDMR